MSDCPTVASTFDMVVQLLERSYTPEQISTQLNTPLKRVKAIQAELERQKASTK